eukprot:m.126462 g.126462  ORF g.126462 m.126462 type:complete len:55 (+) comp12994_c1_seq2:115-279(+)
MIFSLLQHQTQQCFCNRSNRLQFDPSMFKFVAYADMCVSLLSFISEMKTDKLFE